MVPAVNEASAEGRQLLPEKQFSDADLNKLAEAIYENDVYDRPGGWYTPWAEVDKPTFKEYRWRAHGALTHLAAAGRLLPASAEHRQEWSEWAVQFEWGIYPCDNEEHARWSADPARGGSGKVVARRVGPWVEVDGRKELNGSEHRDGVEL
jgi:hypothetical protein